MNLKRDTRVQLVIVENGKFILLNHLRKSDNRAFWGLPGGGREEGETDEEAAHREALEETGLEIKLLPVQWEFLTGDDRYIYRRAVTFLAYPISGTAIVGTEPESEEIEGYDFALMGLKWHDFYDNDGLEAITRGSLIPLREQLAKTPVVRRAGALVYDQKGDQIHYLVVSAKKDPDCLIFPMGHVESGETLEETAAREAQEEAGVEVKIEKNLGFFFYEQDDTIFQTDIFLASLISDGPSSEGREKRWIQLADLDQLNMFREGKRFIRDLHIQ